MKKLSMLVCVMVLGAGLASHAACPCSAGNSSSTMTTAPSACCDAPKSNSCCDTPKNDCCDISKDTDTTSQGCCKVPKDIVVKQDSCCWPLSQEALFKKLCLGTCQLDKANCLYKKLQECNAPLEERLQCEKTKLCDMIKCGKCSADIRNQKKTIKNIEKQIKENWDNYEEDLKCLLTPEQAKDMRKYNAEANSTYKKLKGGSCCCKK